MKRCQIAFDVHPDIRKRIKMYAVRKNISMNLWIARAIYEAMKKEGGEVVPPSHEQKN